MKNYKAYYIINALTDKELTLFESFLKSPYHNTRKKPVELFQFIRKVKDKPEEETSKQKAFQKLYPGKKFNSNTFNDLMAQLHRLAEEFLYIDKMKNEKNTKELKLLLIYFRKGTETIFQKKLIKTRKKISDINGVDLTYFKEMSQFTIAELNYHFTYKNYKNHKDSLAIQSSIKNYVTNLINYFTTEIVAGYSSYLALKNVNSNKKFENDFKKILTHCFSKPFLNTLKPYNEHQNVIEVYGSMLEMYFDENNRKLYFNYKTLCYKVFNIVTEDEKLFLFSQLIKYCTIRLIKNKYELETRKELASLTQDSLRNKYYLRSDQKHVTSSTFRVFLTNYIFLEDVTGIKLLVEELLPFLEKKFQSSHKNLSLAYISFFERKYSDALIFLDKINSDFYIIPHLVKTIYIKIHYHLNNSEQVLSVSDTFLKMLKSEKNMMKDGKQELIAFTKLIRQIVIAESKNNKEIISAINYQLQKNFLVANRDWLLKITTNYLKNK